MNYPCIPDLPTPLRVLNAVKKLAAQYPDRKSACKYILPDGETPDCIVGTALVGLGVSPRPLWLRNATGVHSLYGVSKDDRKFRGSIKLLTQIQTEQDSGFNWANALRIALDEMTDF